MKKIIFFFFIFLVSCTTTEMEIQTKLAGRYFTAIKNLDENINVHHGYKFISETDAIYFTYYYQSETVIYGSITYPEKYSVWSKTNIKYTHDNNSIIVSNQPNYSNMNCKLYDSTMIDIPMSKLALSVVEKESKEWKFITDSIK